MRLPALIASASSRYRAPALGAQPFPFAYDGVSLRVRERGKEPGKNEPPCPSSARPVQRPETAFRTQQDDGGLPYGRRWSFRLQAPERREGTLLLGRPFAVPPLPASPVRFRSLAARRHCTAIKARRRPYCAQFGHDAVSFDDPLGCTSLILAPQDGQKQGRRRLCLRRNPFAALGQSSASARQRGFLRPDKARAVFWFPGWQRQCRARWLRRDAV